MALSKRVQIGFGKKLHHARRNAKYGRMQQHTLAVALDVSRTTISNIERGRHRVFLDQVYAAAHALGVGMEELLPKFDEIFPAAAVIAAPDASVTAHSMRAVGELARAIQERAARSDLPRRESAPKKAARRR
jgi:transcriptional regulator with XRE-family HTH domain